MNKATTINLSGQLFNIDDDAYAHLKQYLDKLRTRLKDDADRDEIVQDFEAAIAEHLHEQLAEKRDVVTLAMVKKVTKTIGEYEPAEDQADQAEASTEPKGNDWRAPFKHRLYLNKDDAMIAGVCGGIARSLDVDAFWIRVLFVVLLFATSGFMIVIYIILSFIMIDPTEVSKGFGANGHPLNAAALVARSKEHFETTKNSLRRTQPRLTVAAQMVKRVLRLLSTAVSMLAIMGITVTYAVLIATWLSNRANPNQPLIASPGGVNYGLFVGSYLVLVLPLIVVLLVSASRRIARMALDMRVAFLLFATWLVALGILAASVAVAVPDWANWSKQHPHNPYFQLQVQNGHVDNVCLSASGDCNDHPVDVTKPYGPPTPMLRKAIEVPAPPAPVVTN